MTPEERALLFKLRDQMDSLMSYMDEIMPLVRRANSMLGNTSLATARMAVAKLGRKNV
jgi:hypothetical protein